MKQYKVPLNAVSLKFTKTEFPSAKILTSRDSADFIRQFYADDLNIFESFFLLLLNRANNTIGFAKISQGGCTGTVVDIKLVCKYAIESLAQSVVLCHNHPSGNTKPSPQDIELTKKAVNALLLFEIKVLDHIILTNDNYFSFADDGLL